MDFIDYHGFIVYHGLEYDLWIIVDSGIWQVPLQLSLLDTKLMKLMWMLTVNYTSAFI